MIITGFADFWDAEEETPWVSQTREWVIVCVLEPLALFVVATFFFLGGLAV
jgi:hypothetical protein